MIKRKRRAVLKDHPLQGTIVRYRGKRFFVCGLVTKVLASRSDPTKVGAVKVRSEGVDKAGPDPHMLPERTWARTLLFLNGPVREVPAGEIMEVTLGPPEEHTTHRAEDYWAWLEGQS